MNYYDRKPDLETESFRAWKPTEEEKKELDKDKGFKVKYKDMELNLMGFTIVKKKTTDEPIFAYKFKLDKGEVVYFIIKESDEQTSKLINDFKVIMSSLGLTLVNMEDTLKNIYNEKNSLDKI